MWRGEGVCGIYDIYSSVDHFSLSGVPLRVIFLRVISLRFISFGVMGAFLYRGLASGVGSRFY